MSIAAYILLISFLFKVAKVKYNNNTLEVESSYIDIKHLFLRNDYLKKNYNIMSRN